MDPDGPGLNRCRAHFPSLLRMHRRHVDGVGPFVASLVAVVHQARRDRVAVGVVADQDTAEVVPALGVERSRMDRRSAQSVNVAGLLAKAA
jgi:hypothetical protein